MDINTLRAIVTVITVVRWLAVRRDPPARGSDQAV